MKKEYRLLNHPFYKDWTKGEVSLPQLANYHKSYSEFIELMPLYWQKINDGFQLNSPEAKEIVEDEQSHIDHWAKWAHRLPQIDSHNRMSELIDTLNEMTPSELLGAIQAFETQQPEVAETKKAGLLEHYGYKETDTTYFDEHMEEEEHIAYGNKIKEEHADAEEYEYGYNTGAKLFYDALDLFMA